LAVGAGFGAQSLLRPAGIHPDHDVLEALIAAPAPTQVTTPQAAANVSPSPQPTSAPTVRRAAQEGSGDGLAEPEAGAVVDMEIRVALLKISANPTLSASGAWTLLDRDGKVLQQGGPGQTADLGAALASRPEAWLQTAPGSHLTADGQPYDGRFRVLRAANGVQVVNHLSLERYISSVVGGEMPSDWNIEALRAQAVAARSYAMAHMARPADAQWHLGDTTRWQNYTGLTSVNGRTREATSSTAGVILSYQGGIVESLYAATQQIVEEAHGSLGASMSQTGAQELAQQGLRYNEILGRYYQGASLARLQAGAG
jgi:hypothetical protein